MFIASRPPFVPRNRQRIGDVDSGPRLESSGLDEKSPFVSMNAASSPELLGNGCVCEFMY
jgi:hypothetical protein